MKRNLLLAVFALLVALGLTEVVLRTTHAFGARLSWTEPDAEIGWRFKPGREYWFFKENDHAITGRISRLGWRDRDRDRTADVRVAVVGDSYVEAFQVELDSTFVAVAERTANARAAGEMRTFEFWNRGRSGMGPAEESIVLTRDVLPLAPDIVVLVLTPSNDIADVSRATASDFLRPFYLVGANDSLVLDDSFHRSKGYRLRAWLNPIKERSALVSLVAERYNASRVARSVKNVSRDAAASANQLTRVQTVMTAHPDAGFLSNYGLTKRVWAEMARLCASHGVALVVTSVPVVYRDSEVAELRARDGSFDPSFFDRDLAAMADSSGFAYFPLTSAFSERARSTGKRLDWAHWNYDGHRLVGEALAEAVLASAEASDGPNKR